MLAECKTKTHAIVEQYMSDVLDGTVPACQYVTLAVKRHLHDLDTASERGLMFDPAAAERIIEFTQLLKQSKGKWAGKQLKLEPWQIFIKWVLFGWKNIDGTRRFRTAYQEVARKNGKSTDIATVGLYGLGFDGEGGAEVYSIATKEDQARITLNEGRSMTKKSVNLGGLAAVHKKTISIDDQDAVWMALGRDSDKQDGLNPHMVLVDEFHAHPDRSLVDVMDSAIGSRLQPLVYIITTAGFNVHSACHSERDYAIKVLQGIVADDSYFAIIFTLDEGDDWKDESVWIKANPNLGVTVDVNDMRRMCKKAIESPQALNNFLTKKLNIWTTQETKFFNLEKWDVCKDKIEESSLTGCKCWLAADLASKTDIACLIAMFPLDSGQIAVIPKFYCPKDGARDRSRVDRVPYLAWAEQGYLTLTSGVETDYDVIKAGIFDICERYDVQGMAYDPWNFAHMRQSMAKEGFDEKLLVEFTQTIKHFSEPTKQLESFVLSKKIVHNNNPVLRWMAENTAVYKDPNDNIRPVKNKSSEKIDGIVALIMAIGLWQLEPAAKESVYESRGALLL